MQIIKCERDKGGDCFYNIHSECKLQVTILNCIRERWKIMKLRKRCTNDIRPKKRTAKLLAGLGVVLLMAVPCSFISYAYERPNSIAEIEPNDTQETAQITTQNNEIVEKIADLDFSGRYSVFGRATSADDDWYKVVLTKGEQYLSVIHSYGDHATYVELLDSNNNVIIPRTYGTSRNVVNFYSEGGTYYVHITGALEGESEYTLFVGTPMVSSEEVNVLLSTSSTSGTIKRSFSLAGETILPDDAIVSKIVLRDLLVGFSGARVTNSEYSHSINYSHTSSSGSIASLGIGLKSRWDVTFYPKGTVKSFPVVSFQYAYPVRNNTIYEHSPTLRK